MGRTLYRGLPDKSEELFLNPERGWVSLVVPTGADITNLISNPSFELNITGATAKIGTETLSQSTDRARRGLYSLKCVTAATLGSGVTQAVSLTSGTTYCFTLDFYGKAGASYDLIANALTIKTFKATGNWQRLCGFWTATSSASFAFGVKTNFAAVHTFYTDGWMLYAGMVEETYVDGDQSGFVPNRTDYYWTGTAHASTSVRIGQSRAGGQIVNLDQLGFRLISIIGLGLGFINNVATERADGGAYYQRSVQQDRKISLIGQWEQASQQELMQSRATLHQALDPFQLNITQPCYLLLEAYNCQEPLGKRVFIPAVYAGGLEGETGLIYNGRDTVDFQTFGTEAATEEGEYGSVMNFAETVTNANYILKRSPTGSWSALGTGASGGAVWALAVGSDGAVYAGGAFTSMGGVANTSRIAKWSNGAWTALGTGAAGGTVFALAIGIDGALYAGGDFTGMGGVANTDGIAKWSGGAWSALSTGMDAGSTGVQALGVGPDGAIYAGGSFTGMGSVANTFGFAKWTGAAWVAVGTGTGGWASAKGAIIAAPDGSIYIGANVANVGGVAAADAVARWSGTAWGGVGHSGGAVQVESLAWGYDGYLYAGGYHTALGGVAGTEDFARWNGSSWASLNAQLTAGVDAIFNIAPRPSGEVYLSGTFPDIGGVTTPDGLAIWNGSTYVPASIALPGLAITYAMVFGPDGSLYLGYSTNGSAVGEMSTTITNSGTAPSYPRFVITGPGTLYQIKNYSTNDVLYFNLILAAGEIVTLDLDPKRIRLNSSVRGNILGEILPGSNLATFRLIPGANIISIYLADTTGASGVKAFWRSVFKTLDGAIR